MSWRVLNEIYNAKGIKRRLVALTGVEPAVRQFSSVQLGLSGCRFSTVGVRKVIEHTPRIRDVLPRSCPGAGFRRTKPRAKPPKHPAR
jgi:hypothetical protein